MPDVLSELVVAIIADAKELKKGLSDATHDVQSWAQDNEKQFKAVGAALTGVGATVVGTFGLMTKAAVDERVNIARLSQTLKNVGVSYDDVKESLEGVITATQKKTGIADDKQRDALSQLILVTNNYEEALSLLPTALDLAAAGQIDVSTASRLLGRVMEGDTEALNRYGIKVKEGATATEALAQIQERVTGSAEAMANPFNVMQASIGDVAEKIGKILLPVLDKMVQIIIPITDNIQAWVDKHPELAKQIMIVVGVIGALAIVLGPLLIMLPGLMIAFGLLTGPIGLVVLAVMALAAIAALVIANWSNITNFFAELWGNVTNTISNAWKTIVFFIQEHWDKILAILFPPVGLPILIARNWGAIVDVINDIWKRVKEKVADSIDWIIDKVNNVIDFINKIPGVNIGNVNSVNGKKMAGFAEGGIVTQPTLAMVGEAGAEAIIPLEDWRMPDITNNIYIGSFTSNSPADIDALADKMAQRIRARTGIR